MSAWRLAVRELYAAGGECHRARMSGDITRAALDEAARRGMIEAPGKNGDRIYRLTADGWALAQNRLAMVVRRTGTFDLGRPVGSVLVPRPTWLASLPTGIRLEQQCSVS